MKLLKNNILPGTAEPAAHFNSQNALSRLWQVSRREVPGYNSINNK